MPPPLNFKEIAENVDIEQVAAHLGIALKRGKDVRGSCPACTGDERSLQIFPESNSFRCYSASMSGDCIALYSHIKGYQGMYKAAKEVSELFVTPHGGRTTAPPTIPQEPGGSPPARTAAPAAGTSKRPPEFDPDAYIAKLDFAHEQVKALGLTPEEAMELGVGYSTTGFHRNTLVFAIRWPSGEIAGFASATDLKFPRKLLPMKVVHLRRA